MRSIARLRKKAKVTQAELAAKLSVTQSAISQWEHGETQPEVGKLLKLSEIFGCTVDEILKGE